MTKNLIGYSVKAFFSLMVFLVSFSVCSAFAADAVPEFSSPKNKIIVTPAQPQFVITLKSNPTTGYSWRIAQIDSTMFTNSGHQYVAPKTRLLGASGYEVWTFNAIYPAHPFAVNQVGHVVMEYTRSWSKEKPAIVNHFTVVLKKK